MTIESLIAELPDQVRYERRELPPEQNALGPWLAAGAAMVECARTTELCCAVTWHGAHGDGGENDPFPTGAEREELDGLLARNAPALQLIDAGLSRSRLQLPLTVWPDFVQVGDPVGVAWRSLARMRYARAMLMLRDGQPDVAAGDAIAMHRMGSMICTSEGLVLQYMLGAAYRNWGLRLMREVAATPAIDSTTRRELADAVDRAWQSEDGLATSLRVEACCHNVRAIEALAAAQGFEPLLDALFERYFSNEPTLNVIGDESDPEYVRAEIVAARRENRQRQLQLLLRDHSQLFDAVATARRLGEIYAWHLGQIEAGPPNAPSRWERVKEGLGFWTGWGQESDVERAWPVSLRPQTCFDWYGDDPQAVAARAWIASSGSIPRWYARRLAPISDGRVRRYAKRLRRIANPVGEIIAPTLASCHPKLTWDYWAELKALRRSLSIRQAA
jgi:hypothetical protein